MDAAKRMEEAIGLMSDLCGDGKSPGAAAWIAAKEWNVDAGELARSAQLRKAEYQVERRLAEGRLTLDECRDHIRRYGTEVAWVRRGAKALANAIFIEVMQTPRVERSISRAYLDRQHELGDPDDQFVVFIELRRLFGALGDRDPRPVEKSTMSRSDPGWPAWEESAFCRRVPRGE